VDRESRRIVADGYDAIAERYLEWSGESSSPGREHALAEISALVPAGARILDLGCGAGVPMSKTLAERHRVHGVDISPRQIELARALVPDATFECADFTNLVIPDGSYDAVVASFSLTHVEREDLPPLLARICRWLRPNGTFIAAFGTRHDPGTIEDDWLARPCSSATSTRP